MFSVESRIIFSVYIKCMYLYYVGDLSVVPDHIAYPRSIIRAYTVRYGVTEIFIMIRTYTVRYAVIEIFIYALYQCSTSVVPENRAYSCNTIRSYTVRYAVIEIFFIRMAYSFMTSTTSVVPENRAYIAV